ncbi:uncharacterized protein LOC134689591 [Mytilus trossulus]|uniref:uncharacterized protein LOC134689591 n=1 Tax=Mytilus trossulus TaxID=6551 RepID=UPI003006AA2A
MPPFNETSWKQNVFGSVPDVNAVKHLLESSHFNPKRVFSENTKTYYIYCQPILLLLIIGWMGLSLKLVWTHDLKKKYGIMIAYTSLDILASVMQNAMFIVNFTTNDNYVEYNWCIAYEIATNYFPGCLGMISQWLKIGLSLMVFILLYNPMKFKIIVSAKSCALYISFSIICPCAVKVASFLMHFKIEKETKIEKAKQQITQTCRYVTRVTVGTKQIDSSESVLHIINDIVQAILPGILMISLAIGTTFIIRNHTKTRRRLQRQQSNNEDSDFRLAWVTIVATVFHVIYVLPVIINRIVTSSSIASIDMYDTTTTVLRILTVISVPINFLIFSWLSKDFRCKCIAIMKNIGILSRPASSD